MPSYPSQHTDHLALVEENSKCHTENTLPFPGSPSKHHTAASVTKYRRKPTVKDRLGLAACGTIL